MNNVHFALALAIGNAAGSIAAITEVKRDSVNTDQKHMELLVEIVDMAEDCANWDEYIEAVQFKLQEAQQDEE